MSFQSGDVFLGSERISEEIRTEQTGNLASKIATMHPVREALLQWQRDCAKAPGLVADGRDMGTVVFPNALLKIYLQASLTERTMRRYRQLKDKGISANLAHLEQEIQQRDLRDQTRSVAPMQPASDAILIDTTQLHIDQVVSKILNLLQPLIERFEHTV